MKEEKIKVLALLPMELPKEIDLDNTLEAMQKFVGGLIECITLSDTGSEVTLVCNCLLYTSPSPRDISGSRMPSSA